jgi:hypothetical protein
MRHILSIISRVFRRSKSVAAAVPAPGRKMGPQEAQDYVFKTYHETLDLLAKH